MNIVLDDGGLRVNCSASRESLFLQGSNGSLSDGITHSVEVKWNPYSNDSLSTHTHTSKHTPVWESKVSWYVSQFKNGTLFKVVRRTPKNEPHVQQTSFF